MDGAVFVLSSVEGIQAQIEVLWKALRELSIPTIIFISKIDRIGSDINRVLNELHKNFSESTIPMQFVVGEGTDQPVVIDPLAINEKTLYKDDIIQNRFMSIKSILNENEANNIQVLLDESTFAGNN